MNKERRREKHSHRMPFAAVRVKDPSEITVLLLWTLLEEIWTAVGVVVLLLVAWAVVLLPPCCCCRTGAVLVLPSAIVG